MPWEKRLDNGLLLRTVRDERDMVRFAAFNEEINNRIEGLTCDRLLRNFPGSVNDNFHIIEDPQTGEVVSTTCIIPWRLYFCGVALDVAMPEMVVSRPSHRKLGLVRIQMERIAQAFVERKTDLAILWGIPNYYRQYGYSYAVEGSVAEALHPSRIPKDLSARGKLKLVPAGEGDIPALVDHYQELVRPLDVFIQLLAVDLAADQIQEPRLGLDLGFQPLPGGDRIAHETDFGDPFQETFVDYEHRAFVERLVAFQNRDLRLGVAFGLIVVLQLPPGLFHRVTIERLADFQPILFGQGLVAERSVPQVFDVTNGGTLEHLERDCDPFGCVLGVGFHVIEPAG